MALAIVPNPRFGVVPHYIPNYRAKDYIRRNLQLSFDFPLILGKCDPDTSPASQRRRARQRILEDRQPALWPRGWFALSVADPNWRAKYNADWTAMRKALGLPHVIHSTPARERGESCMNKGRKTA